MDNKDGKSVADYFGVTGDAPRVSFSPYSVPAFVSICPFMYLIHPRLEPTFGCHPFACRFLHTQEMMMPRSMYWMVN